MEPSSNLHGNEDPAERLRYATGPRSMNERFKGLVAKEEEFLEDFSSAAGTAAELLEGEWEPNYSCSDLARKNRDYFLSTGELQDLVFDTAAIYHDDSGFSSVQIVLKSASRVVTVRVRKTDKGYSAEKIVSKQL